MHIECCLWLSFSYIMLNTWHFTSAHIPPPMSTFSLLTGSPGYLYDKHIFLLGTILCTNVIDEEAYIQLYLLSTPRSFYNDLFSVLTAFPISLFVAVFLDLGNGNLLLKEYNSFFLIKSTPLFQLRLFIYTTFYLLY